MLALTDDAAEAVRVLVESEEAPETGGLRFASARAGAETALLLNVAVLPAEDDEVIEEQGARVFLEQEAASLLDDKILDASVEQNRLAFAIADQVEE